MTGDNKWIRPLKDNGAGKVVTDGARSRWEWDAQQDETSRQLRKLQNDELAIEQTNIRPRGLARGTRQSTAPAPPSKPLKKASRDAGGGFDPYDNDSTGKPPRR